MFYNYLNAFYKKEVNNYKINSCKYYSDKLYFIY